MKKGRQGNWVMGTSCTRNGVGILLSPELKERVIQVNRKTDRMVWLKLEVNKVIREHHQCICPTGRI